MAEPRFDPGAALGLVDALDGREVLILGDVMLDRYWWGTVSRLSPEAPVPVVHKQRTTVAPGGAANVAANVASLGGHPMLVSVVGADEAAGELATALAERGVHGACLLPDPDRPTTVKTRVVAASQHVVRVDEEDRSPVPPALATQMAERVVGLLDRVRVVVVSDYAKGLLSPALLAQVIAAARARGVRVIVDPKGADYRRYDGATLVCPNRAEALAATGLDAEAPDAVASAGARLLEQLRVDAALVTLGEAGMALFEGGRPPLLIPARGRAVYDVTGAGDTVMAALGLTLAAGAPLALAVHVANVAAGLAVEQVGTTAVTSAHLRRALAERAATAVGHRPRGRGDARGVGGRRRG